MILSYKKQHTCQTRQHDVYVQNTTSGKFKKCTVSIHFMFDSDQFYCLPSFILCIFVEKQNDGLPCRNI